LAAAASLEQVRRARAAEGARAHLTELVRSFREALEARGVRLLVGSFGPIVAVLIGEADHAVQAARALRAEGLLVQAIRPPTVPAGAARLRVTVTARHTPSDLERAAEALARAVGASS
jgi:8-amino-7-oxononanoate synthase